MNVYLSGLIGSGKTTLGRRLAARLGRPFLDLDRELDAALGGSFHDLVRAQGWLAFREREYEIVKRFAAATRTVCALGGGTVRYAWNRDALRGTGVTVFLEAELATLAARVRAAGDRPRVNPGISLEEDLAAIWVAAAPLYRDADLTYRTDAGRGEDEEVEELAVLLRGRGLD